MAARVSSFLHNASKETQEVAKKARSSESQEKKSESKSSIASSFFLDSIQQSMDEDSGSDTFESSQLLPDTEFTNIATKTRSDSIVSFAADLEEEIPFFAQHTLKTLPEAKPHIPRLVKRDLPFDQSSNKLQVYHKQGMRKLFVLLKHDWFHIIARLPMFISVFSLLAIWTGALLVFALLYVGVDDGHCGLGTEESNIGFGGAFAFSLETATTSTHVGAVSFFFLLVDACVLTSNSLRFHSWL